MEKHLQRLSVIDVSNLRLEDSSAPCHVAALATAEGATLLDDSGRLRMQQIGERLDRRTTRVPELRKRLFAPGLLRGRPLWIDDDHFDIKRHVFEFAVNPPGDEQQLLEAAAHLYDRLLDRSKPLWELWFLTGLRDGHVGLLFKLHHALADGMAAIAIFGSLFEFEPDAPELAPRQWLPEPSPGSWEVLADNLAGKGLALRRIFKAMAHPATLARTSKAFVRDMRRTLEQAHAPRTSLNRPVRPGRRLGVVRVDLARAKDVAHSHEAKVNDLVLDLWAAGLRQLLASRGEAVAGGKLVTSVAVSMRGDDDAASLGNRIGILAVPISVAEPNSRLRLEQIATATRNAKNEQLSTAVESALGGLAATPIARYFTAHQHMVNVFSTNLAGPPVPVYILGARIHDILPIIQVAGNVAVSLCAFSYAGTISLVVTADATSFPDLGALVAGMAAGWAELTEKPGAGTQVLAGQPMEIAR